MQKQSYFITGTDTNVGKTYITCNLIKYFATLGVGVLGMKPVAAGCELENDELMNDDVCQLLDASNIKASIKLINPYAFQPAIAPHIAAKQAGIIISLDVITTAFVQLQKLADVVIVEGVGGFCVPLNETETTADLAVKLKLPIILVVGMRLGCINHALLTLQAIQARGLTLAGWIANQVSDEMTAYQENFNTLEKLISAPCLSQVKWNETATFLSL